MILTKGIKSFLIFLYFVGCQDVVDADPDKRYEDTVVENVRRTSVSLDGDGQRRVEVTQTKTETKKVIVHPDDGSVGLTNLNEGPSSEHQVPRRAPAIPEPHPLENQNPEKPEENRYGDGPKPDAYVSQDHGGPYPAGRRLDGATIQPRIDDFVQYRPDSVPELKTEVPRVVEYPKRPFDKKGEVSEYAY